MQSKEQRIGVLVDVQNLYYSARGLYKRRVNFKEVLREAVKGRKLIRAIAYVIKSYIIKEKSFFDALGKIGYEVKSKDLQIFIGGTKKGDWDIGIAMDAIELANKLDTIVIASGDGDFIQLVQHLRMAFGCRVESMSFGKSTSGKLIEEVDEFTDLDKNRKFLIKEQPRREPAKKEPVKK
jgi:uncharacterized LabA/DUF88 family protein